MSRSLTRIDARRAALNLKHLGAMIDEYIDFACREKLPDLMTPLLHMDRDLWLLGKMLEEWCPLIDAAAQARAQTDGKYNP